MSATAVAPAASSLRFDATLPAPLVHKTTIEQVFVTDYMEGPSPAVCTIAAQLPLAHGRFSDVASPHHDPLGVGEAVRQAGVVAATKVLGVPHDWQFLLRALRLELAPLERFVRVRSNTELLVTADPSSKIKQRRDGSTAGAVLRAGLAMGGEPSGSADVSGAWVRREVYDGFRGAGAGALSEEGALLELADREPCSGSSPRNTVIAQLRRGEERGTYSTAVVVDVNEPTFFDPVVDHVPGLLLLDALKQAAIAATCVERGAPPDHVSVTALRIRFSRMVELGHETVCTVRLGTDGGAEVSCSQGPRVCCGGTIDVVVL